MTSFWPLAVRESCVPDMVRQHGLVMQEFVYGLTFITSASQKTISVGVPTDLVRGDVYYWGPLMGGCLIASVLVVILYNFSLDRFIAGFTVGVIR
jgi:multiple sugar transport system permease protein